MKKLPTILLYLAIILSGIYIVLLSLGAFGVLALEKFAGAHFNYIFALVIVIVALALYIAFMFVEKWRKLVIPNWFKTLFYIAFFVFTNVYYFFSWYSSVAGLIVFDIYFASLLNILAISLFYNTQKDERNNVKTSEKFLVFSCFCYAATGAALYAMVVSLVKVFAKSTSIYASLAMMVTELSVMLCVNFMFALMFTFSMKGTRTFVNSCLIKYTGDKPKVK